MAFNKREMNLTQRRLFGKAASVTRNESPFGYWLSLIFFPLEQRETLFLLYTYFRWVDDNVDQPGFDFISSRQFIHRQIKSAYARYEDDHTIKSENLFEAMAAAAIQKDKIKGNQLQNMIIGFLEAIAWDVERRYKIVSQIDLDRYSLLLGKSYSEGLLYGLKLDPEEPGYLPPKTLCGVAAHWAHILRDIQEDLQIGYINLSKEEIERFSIDFRDANTLYPWMEAKCYQALDMFAEGRKARNVLPTYKARIVFDLTCLKHISTIYRIINHLYMKSHGATA